MDYKKMILQRRGEVTTITLNRPDRHNALDKELSAELNHAVREVRADRNCRVLVLRGAGNTFCAGDDIQDFATWTLEDLVNRLVEPADLDNEVGKLIEVVLAKNPVALRRTKFALNRSADMTAHQALSLERPIMPFPLASVNGDIEAINIDGSVSVQLTNGNVEARVTLPPDGIVEVTIGNGDTDLFISVNTSATFFAAVGNGSIEISNLELQNLVRINKTAMGVLGEGNGAITLQTGNGRITASGF